MAVDVQIAPALRKKVMKQEIRKWAVATLRAEGLTQVPDMAVVVTDNDSIQALNRDFRGMDEPTDVLAFGEEKPGPFVLAPGEPMYLGDVVISLERAQAQAQERDAAVTDELQLLSFTASCTCWATTTTMMRSRLRCGIARMRSCSH